MSTRRLDALAVAFLWLLAALFFWPVLFGGRSFYFRDTVVYYYPQACLTARALQEWRLPAWEPTIGLGYPYAADPHAMAFYPLSLLLALLPMPRAYDLHTAVHVPLAATFLYMLLRRWSAGPAAAALGAASYAFCGFTVGATCLTIVLRALSWMPLVLLLFDRFLDSGSRRDLAGTALVLALLGTATEPQHLVFTGAMMLLLPWLRPVGGAIPWQRAIAGTAIASAAAGLALAVQYLPLGQLFAWSARAGGIEAAELAHYQLDPRQALNLALPAPFPDPASPLFLASFPAGVVPLYTDLFFGLPLLALACIALGSSTVPGRSLAVACALAAGGLLLAVGNHLPFFGLLTVLVPPLAVFRYPAKYAVFTAIAVPVLACWGYDALARKEPVPERLLRAALLAVGAAGLLGAALLAMTGDVAPRAFLAGERLQAGGIAPELLRELGSSWIATLLVQGLAASAIFALRRHRLGAIGAWALLTLVWGTRGSFPHCPDEMLTKVPPTSMLLKQIAGESPPPRFVTHPPSRPIRFGEKETTYDRLNLGRELMTQMRGGPHGCNLLTASPALRLDSSRRLQELLGRASDPDALAAAAGARFSLAAAGERLPGRILGRAGDVEIRELDYPTPRAFIAGSAIGVSHPPADSLAKLPAEAVLEKESVGPLTPTTVRECRIESYAPDAVRVRFDLEGRGLLVLMDEFYPGWVARVDGRERPIVRVAGYFRGVEVAGGERVLEMCYEPGLLKLGAAISLVSLLAILAAMLPWPGASRTAPPGTARRGARRA